MYMSTSYLGCMVDVTCSKLSRPPGLALIQLRYRYNNGALIKVYSVLNVYDDYTLILCMYC